MDLYAEYKAKLLDILLKNDLNELARYISEELHCPFNITDVFFNMIVQYPKKPIGDIIWDSYLESKILPAEIIKNLDEKKLIERNPFSTEPFLISSETFDNYPRICARLVSGKKSYGCITIYFIDCDITDDILQKINIARDVIIYHLSKTPDLQVVVSNRYETFIGKLFDGQIYSEKSLDDWRRFLPDSLTPSYCILCAYTDAPSNSSLIATVLNDIKNIYRYFKCTLYHDKLYFIFQDIHSHSHKLLMNQIIHQLKTYGLKIGLSEPFEELLLATSFRKQAVIAATNADKGDYLLFHKIALSMLSHHIISNDELSIFVHPAFHTLMSFDQKNNTEYYDTLLSYIKNFGRQKAMEYELKVHKNTVHNRIKAIESLTKIDLTDAYTFSYLFISYYIMKDCDQGTKNLKV